MKPSNIMEDFWKKIKNIILRIGDFLEIASSSTEEPPKWLIGIGIIVGIILTEYLYIINVDEVRLLVVLIMIPLGILLGYLIVYFLLFALRTITSGLFIALIIGVIYGIFYSIYHILRFLYNIIIWTN